MDTKKLIEEVLLDLGNNKSLTEVSSKIQIIVRLLGNDSLKEWYKYEFVTGYDPDCHNLPDYRISRAADIRADYIAQQGYNLLRVSEQSVPVANLGREIYQDIMQARITDTISAIIDYSHKSERMVMTLNPYERAMVQRVLGNVQIQNVHKVISPSTFQTIIDNVQGRIIDMFMDLDEKVFNGKLDFQSSQGRKEIHQVINNITAGIVQTGSGTIEAQNSTISVKTESPLPVDAIEKLQSLANEIEKVARESSEEFDEIAKEITDIRSELTSPRPQKSLLKKSFKAIAWSTTVSCKAAIEELVKAALGLL